MRLMMKYPLLTAMVNEMGRENSGTIFEERKLLDDEYTWPKNTDILEIKAGELTASERSTMAVGEDSEQRGIVSRMHAEPLNDFLNEVFDGDLHYNFYKKD